jgi:hypothetical protein
MNIIDVVHKMNDGNYFDTNHEPPMSISDEFGQRYAQVLRNQFPEHTRPHLSGSSLGKPAVVLFAMRFFPEMFEEMKPTERLMRVFHEGFIFELQFEWFLHRASLPGVKVLTAHERYNLSELLHTGVPVSGELDYVVEIGGKTYLIDTKTASQNSFRKLITGEVPREYIVQQTVYKAAWEQSTGKTIDATGLLVYNKDNSVVHWVQCDDEERDAMLDHAICVCDLWEKSSTWEEAIANGLTPPDPVPEVYRKKNTGAFLLPDSMKYQPRELIEMCYEVTEDVNGYGKSTLYVIEKRF